MSVARNSHITAQPSRSLQLPTKSPSKKGLLGTRNGSNQAQPLCRAKPRSLQGCFKPIDVEGSENLTARICNSSCGTHWALDVDAYSNSSSPRPSCSCQCAPKLSDSTGPQARLPMARTPTLLLTGNVGPNSPEVRPAPGQVAAETNLGPEGALHCFKPSGMKPSGQLPVKMVHL